MGTNFVSTPRIKNRLFCSICDREKDILFNNPYLPEGMGPFSNCSVDRCEVFLEHLQKTRKADNYGKRVSFCVYPFSNYSKSKGDNVFMSGDMSHAVQPFLFVSGPSVSGCKQDETWSFHGR